jgi:hypothetical protein
MKIAKAIIAAFGTTLTALTVAFADDVLSVEEFGTIASTVVVGAAAVWAVWKVPNKPAE